MGVVFQWPSLCPCVRVATRCSCVVSVVAPLCRLVTRSVSSAKTAGDAMGRDTCSFVAIFHAHLDVMLCVCIEAAVELPRSTIPGLAFQWAWSSVSSGCRMSVGHLVHPNSSYAVAIASRRSHAQNPMSRPSHQVAMVLGPEVLCAIAFYLRRMSVRGRQAVLKLKSTLRSCSSGHQAVQSGEEGLAQVLKRPQKPQRTRYTDLHTVYIYMYIWMRAAISIRPPLPYVTILAWKPYSLELARFNLQLRGGLLKGSAHWMLTCLYSMRCRVRLRKLGRAF